MLRTRSMRLIPMSRPASRWIVRSGLHHGRDATWSWRTLRLRSVGQVRIVGRFGIGIMVPSLSGVGSVMMSAVVRVGAAAATFFLLDFVLSVFEGFGLLPEIASVAFVFGVFAEEVACCYELEVTEDDHFVLCGCCFACGGMLRGCDDCEMI